MITVTAKDIEYLVKSRDDFLEQLKTKNTGLLFGVGDLLNEIIRPYSKNTLIENKVDFLMEIFAYITGLEYAALRKFSPDKLGIEPEILDKMHLVKSQVVFGHGTILVNKKILNALKYYKEQNEDINAFNDWCSEQANRIQRTYDIPITEITKLPLCIYDYLLAFIKGKTELTRAEEMYVDFLNDSIDVALKRFCEDLWLVSVSLYSLRAKTPKTVNNTYCKYCHKAIHRGDSGNSCTKNNNRGCFEQNVGSRTKRRQTKEKIFINTIDKVCVSCGILLDYASCIVFNGKLLCKKSECYEKLKYSLKSSRFKEFP